MDTGSSSTGKRKRRAAAPKLYVHKPAGYVSQPLGVSEDGRRIVSNPQHFPLNGASSSANDDGAMAADPTDDPMMPDDPLAPEGDRTDVIETRVKPKRYANSDAPLRTWALHRDEYLDEVLRLEGRGRYARSHICTGCTAWQPQEPLYRCRDCLGQDAVCRGCVVQRHMHTPLHVVERWDPDISCFRRTTLRDLGLRVQLNHSTGKACPFRSPGNKDFVVIHTNGIHYVNIDFCGCGVEPLKHRTQLLRARLWPATPIEPQTCATMDVLRHFQTLNLQGKLTMHDFYRSLEHMTDGTGLEKVPDRMPAMLLMVREYRHIELMKRAGRGHDPSGIAGTGLGELALKCRACPQPDINLPRGWENAGPDRSWLYRLLVNQDCNFRMKHRYRHNQREDPSLGDGLSYFVPSGPYNEHILAHADQEEIKSCAGFSALIHATTKNAKGLQATGICGVSCARHAMWRPNGVGDLQRGERYCNVDFVFFSSLRGFRLKKLLDSYDIICAWSKHLWARMHMLPRSLHLNIPPEDMAVVVPKFHLAAHRKACQALYSLNFLFGVGRTDAETPERNWASLNGAGPSTKEMTAGGRKDTLDDFCSFMNWRNTVGLEKSLPRLMTLAIPQARQQCLSFKAFDEGLRKERPDQVVEWQGMLDAWVADHDCPCPYEVSEETVTLKEVQAMLKAEEEKNATEGGGSFESDKTVTAFLLAGLELELSQRVLLKNVKQGRTSQHNNSLEDQRSALRKKIERYEEVQRLHMPGITQVLQSENRSRESPLPAEKALLHMPSSLSPTLRDRLCNDTVNDIEARLREAQAADALDGIRHHLRMRSYLNRFKIKNVTGQRPNTRARALQSRVEAKIQKKVDQYQHARASLLTLRGHGDWEKRLQELNPKTDIVAPNAKSIVEDEYREVDHVAAEAGLPRIVDERRGGGDTIQLGEGHRTLSWIWYSVSVAEDDNDSGMHEVLRVEWAKAKARSARWHEQVIMLEEEMRRSIETCEWMARWWVEQGPRRVDRMVIEPELAEGLKAYAAEHAFDELRRAAAWTDKWQDVRGKARTALDELAGFGFVVGTGLGLRGGMTGEGADGDVEAAAAAEAEAEVEAGAVMDDEDFSDGDFVYDDEDYDV